MSVLAIFHIFFSYLSPLPPTTQKLRLQCVHQILLCIFYQDQSCNLQATARQPFLVHNDTQRQAVYKFVRRLRNIPKDKTKS